MKDKAVLLAIKVMKILSFILIVAAIVWEMGSIYAILTDFTISPDLKWIFWIERPALSIHVIEGIIGFYSALYQGKKAIDYGIYTFSVGFIGLLELRTESTHSGE